MTSRGFHIGGGLHSGRIGPASFGSPDASWSVAAEALLVQLVAAAARAEDVRTARAKPWLRDVHDLVRDRAPERFSLTELAREAGVHPVHLARSFKRAYGRTVGDYGRSVRLNWAARQLLEDAPIAQVAAAAGFADQSHFTRVFRRYTGVTPARYRELAGAR